MPILADLRNTPDEVVLRRSVALVWLATAVTVLHPSYQAVGASYLARLGLGPAWMYATCVGEGALAVWLWLRPFGRFLALAQIAAVAVFTALLAAVEPMLLVSPFGMLSKNIPFALAVWAAMRLERGDATARVWPLVVWAAALPWLTEGLLPKLLFQQDVELSMVPQIGIPLAPGLAVGSIGVAQVVSFGLLHVLHGRPLAVLRTAQAAALVALPLVVGLLAPWLWVHPFGPFSKNLPILAATLLCLRREART